MPQLFAQLIAAGGDRPHELIGAALPLVLATYAISVLIYRAFLHPLARVPGPKLAKISWLLEYYYGRQGVLTHKLEEWHKRYGPIVRITPEEVHINDLSNIETFDRVYRMGTKFSKDGTFYRRFNGNNVSFFATANNYEHRQLKASFIPLLARKQIVTLEPYVRKHIDHLCTLLEEEKGSSFNLHVALRSAVMDIISTYCLGTSTNLLDTPEKGIAVMETLRGHFGRIWIHGLMSKELLYRVTHLPLFILSRIDTSKGLLPSLLAKGAEYVGKVKADPSFRGEHGEKTIFHDMLNPPEDKELGFKPKIRIAESSMPDEMAGVIIAGVDTTGLATEMTLIGILEHPEIHERLVRDLDAAYPDGVDLYRYSGLERIPYLVGCIKEGLRLANPTIGRLPRVVEEPNTEFLGFKLRVGTIVSQSTRFHHFNPRVFPDPLEFRPERWVDDNAKGLEKYWNPFGRGARGCVGKDLAMCEMHLLIAVLIKRFPNLRFAENTGLRSTKDVKVEDFFSTFLERGNRGIQVRA